MPKHVFKTEDTDPALIPEFPEWPTQGGKFVDIFAYSIGYCNGPECVVCGWRGCQHCNPGIFEEECPGAQTT